MMGIKLTVIGNNLALVKKTAKKMFKNVPPANIVSAITNWPGSAKVKKEEAKLWNKSKPELFK